DLAEIRAIHFPLSEDRPGAAAAGLMEMLLYQLAQHTLVHRIESADGDHLEVAVRFELAALIEHVGDAVGHPGRKVSADRSQHDHHATRHVFAAMVAGTLDHRDGAGVPHRKAVARAA